MYDEKNGEYYRHIRREVLPLLPKNCKKVLEVGCGQGDTLVWVKSIREDCEWIGGVELFEDSAKIAASQLDWSIKGSIEEIDLDIEESSIDLILCLDVLEHLVDPWGVVARLNKLLKPDGHMISSIPNVRFFSAVFPLVFMGNWAYQKEGILDKTHLRFFTKKTAISLMESSGMKLDIVIGKGLEKGRKARILNFITLGLFRPFLEFQYLIRVKNQNP
jgi:2-polyprenyl-3-methyl-5-hydroxy-6-metoxy-1,4-benzoquinol methylase